ALAASVRQPRPALGRGRPAATPRAAPRPSSPAAPAVPATLAPRTRPGPRGCSAPRTCSAAASTSPGGRLHARQEGGGPCCPRISAGACHTRPPGTVQLCTSIDRLASRDPDAAARRLGGLDVLAGGRVLPPGDRVFGSGLASGVCGPAR